MEATRYGIAEWYGHSFISLSKSEKLKFAGGKSSSFACPFQKSAQCSKAGGVCSLRKYERLSGDSAAPIEDGQIVSLCPNRFLEADDIYRWIGSEVLGSERPRIAKEIPFLVGQDKDARETRTPSVESTRCWCTPTRNVSNGVLLRSSRSISRAPPWEKSLNSSGNTPLEDPTGRERFAGLISVPRVPNA